MFDTLTRLGASAAGDYEIERSVRHNSASTTYFDRTPSSTTNRTTFTFSCWVKFTTPGSSATPTGAIFGVWQDNTSRDTLRFESGKINLQCGQHSENVYTDALFRDPSAWYHIVCAVDSTQAASGDRVAIYVNGVSQSLGTNTLSQNREFKINTDNKHVIGCRWLSDSYHIGFNGYIAEFNFIDGSKLAASSFGETSAITGQWIPKKYGGSYGTNGYYLKFDDNSGTTATTLGKDSSGNGNNFTPNNYSVAANSNNDSVIDTPTNNFCTLNPLYINSGNWPSHGLLWGGTADTAGWRHRLCTMSLPATGKYYWECKIPTVATDGSNGYMTGVCYPPTFTSMQDVNSNSTGMYGRQHTEKYLNDSSNPVDSDFTSVSSNNDILQYAYDADGQKLYTGKNNTWEESANPSTGSNPNWTSVASGGFPFVGSYGNNLRVLVNFGQQGFVYTPPTGYNTLSTANLPTPTIEKPTDYFDTALYSGTGSSNSITGLGFSPNMIITKRRNADGQSWLLVDTIRGGNTSFQTESVAGDNTNANRNMTFDSNGVTWTSDTGNANASGGTYLLTAWKESATAGFDMVSYTGNASGSGDSQTISHSLGVAPEMMIVKARSEPYSGGGKWTVYHKDIDTPTQYFLNLHTDTGKVTTSTDVWNQVAPTSSNFQVGYEFDTNKNSIGYMAYLWSSVEGFSKVGRYEGLGGTDGPFVNVGFRPAYVLIKNIDADSRWWIVKTAALPGYNVTDLGMAYNNTDDEDSLSSIDIVSNGFKIRNNGSYTNTNGATYVYLAFAENPFKYANAR